MEDIDEAISMLQKRIECTRPDDVRKFIREFEDLSKSTTKESPHLKAMPSIYQLNIKTKDLVQKVEKLSSRDIFSEGIALDVFEDKRGDILPTSKLAGETTARRNMEEIWGLIIGDVKKIGVYGMGGIGKSTVMKHINNRILEEKNEKFDCVIWVTVSKDSSVVKLQDDIACKLDVNISNYEDTTTRAGTLFKALKQKGRYLLILDDLWEGYPLEDIGIPDPDDPTSRNGCKLVLTTRLHKVCQTMKCEAIKMDLLSENEAWSLFLDHVGHDVLNVKDLEPIIRGVASECARLPLAISTIGRSMRGEKEACEWRVALAKLRAFFKESGDKGKRVIEQLRFSYDRLEDKKLKNCLLFCSLYPEDYEIERGQLVELLALEGIIEENESKRQEIDEGNAMLNNLIHQCLLEGEITSKENSRVKMHDLVRDMALQIDAQYLAVSGIELRKLSHVKWSKNLLKIHISNCYSLEVSPICPTLTTLILRDHSLRNIPDLFFQHFKSLKVLNLSGCRSLLELPNSISELVNLVGLLLRDCSWLRFVPPLAKLKDLRSLDLSLTIIRYDPLLMRNVGRPITVPKGLEELSNLRYLNLISFPIEVFPRGIIPRLSNLQYLVCSPYTKVNASELISLKCLEMFKGAFHDINDLRVCVKHIEQKRSRLTSYTFLLGLTPRYLRVHNDAYGDNYFEKVVKLVDCNLCTPPGENDIFLLPKDVQMLEIGCVHDFTSLCALTSLNYATDLRICKIKYCNGVRELVTASSSSSLALQSLQRLELVYLKNLEALIGRMKKSCNAFSCLQGLYICGCPRIKVLFNIGILSNLNNLEELLVYGCMTLVEIIGESSNDDKDLNEAMTDAILPKLRSLHFKQLPSLKSICPATTRLICRSLQKIGTMDCPNLEQLSLYASSDNIGQPSPSSSLQRIELTRKENNPRKLHWVRHAISERSLIHVLNLAMYVFVILFHYVMMMFKFSPWH